MKKRFLTPLDQACSKDKLTNQFSYVYFKDEFLYVSNGRVHIKQHMELHGFSTSLAEKLDGYCMHKDMFKLINRQSDIEILNFALSTPRDCYIDFFIAGSKIRCQLPKHLEVPGKGDAIRYIDSMYDKFELKETHVVTLDPDSITLIRKFRKEEKTP